MFARRFFAARSFAPHYFPGVGADAPADAPATRIPTITRFGMGSSKTPGLESPTYRPRTKGLRTPRMR